MMAATHSWGIRPTLFTLGSVGVPAYAVFMGLAICAAVISFVLESRRQRAPFEHGLALALAAGIGGTLGAKLPIWLMHARALFGGSLSLPAILSGRTIVGGLLGGIAAVILTRRWLKLPLPSGNLFAAGLALAIAIGRLGCFCAGCCYGIPTHLPWGVDFGDGVLRFPTQLMESAFALLLFAYLLAMKTRLRAAGQLFTHFILAYFTFRFAIEFLRDEPRPYLRLTLAQVVSAGIVLYYLIRPPYKTRPIEGAQHG